ncbi:MAG: hypothetical protein ABI873_14290, partial [Marmoricola sp.]
AFLDAVPSKLYEYLAAGIVPIVSDLPRQRQLVAEAGSGVVVAGAASAASALLSLQNNPGERLRACSAGLSWSAGFGGGAGYDRLAAAVLEVSRG